LTGIYDYQKGGSIYYSWCRKNPGWIPPLKALEEHNNKHNKSKASFEQIINNEKIRIKNKKSFFIS